MNNEQLANLRNMKGSGSGELRQDEWGSWYVAYEKHETEEEGRERLRRNPPKPRWTKEAQKDWESFHGGK
tara:strand:- start:6 stop:215 length:210 start_codon:yes stop_codon:yes gene_type:complete